MILVTGAAGFIGSHICQRLLAGGHQVVGLDNLNDYYSPALKKKRLVHLQGSKNFLFYQKDFADQLAVEQVFSTYRFTTIIHLGAQAGVRYSVQNPRAYINSNLVGFFNVLEAARAQKVGHFIFASTSSVYGLNTHMPFNTQDHADHPVSLYAATKKSNEAMAHSYAYMHGLPVTGLRFFTVYGPWGRPDMAYFLFTDAIAKGEPITLFNEGLLRRDFTYIDDIVEGIVRLTDKPPQKNEHYDRSNPDPSTSSAPYRILNIGNHDPVEVKQLLSLIEQGLGKKAKIIHAPMQKGDVEATFANTDPLNRLTGFTPQTSLAEGVGRFIAWYKDYYHH
jgi:UDP-glucuronate 4-epimerase